MSKEKKTSLPPPPPDIDKETSQFIRSIFRDVNEATNKMHVKEARYLVDLYYQLQDVRIRSSGQIRASEGKPTYSLTITKQFFAIGETSIRNVLGRYAGQFNIGNWLQSICGIGPVLSAGFIANLDITRAKTAGQFWSFCGLNPGVEWKKKTKRPWSAAAKVLCFKAGSSFIKVHNNSKDFYGQYFVKRRTYEQSRNEAGELAGQAHEKLEKYNISKTTDAYKAYSKGILPPAHIEARARRWTVKLFLSHLHKIMHEEYYGVSPPIPYAFTDFCKDLPTTKTSDDHVHMVDPPNYPPVTNLKSCKEIYPLKTKDTE